MYWHHHFERECERECMYACILFYACIYYNVRSVSDDEPMYCCCCCCCSMHNTHSVYLFSARWMLLPFVFGSEDCCVYCICAAVASSNHLALDLCRCCCCCCCFFHLLCTRYFFFFYRSLHYCCCCCLIPRWPVEVVVYMHVAVLFYFSLSFSFGVFFCCLPLLLLPHKLISYIVHVYRQRITSNILI